MACAGCRGVLATLTTRPSDAKTSVKVPPVSTPMTTALVASIRFLRGSAFADYSIAGPALNVQLSMHLTTTLPGKTDAPVCLLECPAGKEIAYIHDGPIQHTAIHRAASS